MVNTQLWMHCIVSLSQDAEIPDTQAVTDHQVVLVMTQLWMHCIVSLYQDAEIPDTQAVTDHQVVRLCGGLRYDPCAHYCGRNVV